MSDTHKRSIAKAISWRATGTLDTFVLSWLITGHAATAGGIALTEVFTKIALYYLHERAWARFGRPPAGREAHARSLAKAISWRATGSMDTFLISLVFTGQLSTAGGIAATEVVTKIALYYLHERAWALVSWGRQRPPESKPAQPLASPEPLPASN